LASQQVERPLLAVKVFDSVDPMIMISKDIFTLPFYVLYLKEHKNICVHYSANTQVTRGLGRRVDSHSGSLRLRVTFPACPQRSLPLLSKG
jgi:hypothetical protein